MTTGTIIGLRLVRSLTNLPAALRTCALEASRCPGSVSSKASSTACAHGVGALVEQVLGLGGVDPAAGDDLGPGEDRAGRPRRR